MIRRFAFLLCIASCGGPEQPAVVPYELKPVVAPQIATLGAALEAELAREAKPDASKEPALPLSEVSDLLGAVAGSEGKLRLAAIDDLVRLGDRAVPALREELVATDDDPSQRAVAVEVLGVLATPAAVDVLLERLERARREVDPEPWMRAHCAWRLPLAKADWARDRLLLDLKYEVDYETVIWIARTLEATGSLAGVVGLDVIARGDQPERAAEAVGWLQTFAEKRGLADGAALIAAYERGDFVASDDGPPLSTRAKLATWKRIAGLAEWQLRGVDDSRFVLLQSGATAVEALALALHDDNRYIRVHSAQVLERMGRRASAATDALIAALDERELAPQAARSLARVGDVRARAALARALDAARPFELRVATARALAELGADGVEATLQPLLAPETPLDLRIAAASALLSTRGFADAAAELAILGDALRADGADTQAVEAALERWLARAGESAAEFSKRWAETATDPKRAAARGALVRELAQRAK
ncbi:MAG: HEAT repeat domain-containing protein [Planctomycetes bacterium]|nr:HEAT repeat domain-containing protein [Planctomycetota bacterium]